MYIARHDHALRLALKSIVKGDHGGYYTIADIGRADLIEDMGVSAKRVPSWLLPDSYLQQANIDPSDRNRVRPDILLVEMTQTESLYYNSIPERPQRLQATMSGQDVPSSSDTTRSANDPEPQRRKVWLIEGG